MRRRSRLLLELFGLMTGSVVVLALAAAAVMVGVLNAVGG